MRFLLRPRWIVSLYLLLAVAVSIHKYMLPAHIVDGTDIEATQYNNYVIFERSGGHLLAGDDLYRTYPDEHWDLFKYSPTFALCAVPLNWLPDWLGLSLWNVANALALLAGILLLPLDERPKAVVAAAGAQRADDLDAEFAEQWAGGRAGPVDRGGAGA